MNEPQFQAVCQLLPEGIAWGDHLTPEVAQAIAASAVDSHRKSVVDLLMAETTLEGFGCACLPGVKCDTCKARDILSRSILPLIRKLETPFGDALPAPSSASRRRRSPCGDA